MQLTTDQERAYRAILDFLHQQDSQIFVLTGYAGTGKTTLIRRVLEDMETR